jgi:SSS family solute:Na+ symporter
MKGEVMANYQIMALIFILIYYAFVIGLSLYRKKVKTEMDYFLAGRTFPAWILAFSYAASWFGGASAIVSADKAFAGGWSAYFVMGGPTICSGIVLLFFARRIRAFAPISQPEMTEARYNRAARIIQSIIIFWYMITWAASQMIGAANFVSGYFGMTYTLGLFVVVAVVWFYCMFGGFKSVVTTDLGQFIWIIVALLIVLVTVISRSGGIGNVKHVVEQKGTENFFNVFGNAKFSLFYIISFTFAWVISAEIWQRFSAAKSVKDAKKISRGALFINIPLYFFAVVIGIFAVALFAEKPEGHVMGAIIKQYVPWYLAGIAFAGLLAAVMSTMDTALNTGALVLTEDIFHKVINPNASEKQLVTTGRVTVTIMAACGIFISLAIKDMLWVLWMASDILAAGVFWPLILGMYGKWGTSKGAVASMLAGGAFSLWHYLIYLGVSLPYLMPSWPGRTWPFSVFWGIVVGFVFYTVISLATQSPEEKMKAETFMNRLADEKS